MKLLDQVQKRFEQKYQKNDAPWEFGEISTEMEEFKNKLLTFDKPKMLDIGCGSGWTTIYYAKGGIKVVGIDSSSTAIEKAKETAFEEGLENIDFRVGNALEFPFDEGSFHGVFDRGLLHHIPPEDWSDYLSGLERVLKTGGYFYLTTFSDKTTNDDGFSPKESGKTGNKHKDGKYWTYDHYFNLKKLNDLFGEEFDLIHSASHSNEKLPGLKLITTIWKKN